MRIVITGGTGFLGSVLAARLRASGCEVVLPLRSPHPDGLAIRPIEAMSAADWAPVLAGADAVVHAAAIAHIGPSVPESAYASVNRDAAARLAEAATGAGVRHFVFLSSIRAQVGARSPSVQSEDTTPMPTEAYGRSKLQAELLIRGVFPQAIILRPALVVGAEPKGNLRTMLRLAASPLPLPFGALDAPQAMVTLDGVIDAVVMALRMPEMAGQIYCVAQEPHLSLAGMLTALRRGLGRKPNLWPVPEAPILALLKLAVGRDVSDRVTGGLRVDASKLMALGWRPAKTVEEALVEMGAQARR